jgi:hypothetical protein
MTSIKIFENLPDPRKANPNTQYSVAQIVFQTIAPLFQVFRLGSLGTSYECFSLPTKTTCTLHKCK